MKLYWPSQCFLVLAMTLAVTCESYYSINAPGTIKSNRKYSVVISLHEASGPCSIRVGIEGPNFKDFQEVNLQPFESQIIEFMPKQLQNGTFLLKAEGISGLRFQNETLLHAIIDDGPKIYIQSDKAVYKPEDLVRFRFLVLDEHTRPLNIDDPIRVEILDPQDNRVKQFKNISLTHDIFTGKFQLSKYPLIGIWKIKVVIDGHYNYSIFKTIKIDQYTLPKFSVHLKTPSNIVLNDGYIKVGIYGKYTFEKYVEGNATIELWNDDRYSLLQTQQVDIQNLEFVDFNLKTIEGIGYISHLAIKASLTEKYTGITERQQKYINLRKQRYDLIIPYDEIEFENNEPIYIKVYVKHWTGAPVLEHKTPVKMENGNETCESFLDSAGVATFKFDYNENADHKFQFKDSIAFAFPRIYRGGNLMSSNREYYCRLRLVHTNNFVFLKLGKPVHIEVSSIENIPYLMYIIMGHASLIKHEYIKVPPNRKTYTISITPSIKMIPQSYIYVYYVHKGYLRYEEMILSFPYEFENQISISAPNEVKPGEQVTVTVNAQPESYVGILAVDLGVHFLNDTYDLNRDKILDDLMKEKSYSYVAAFLYPGIISGLVTITNSLLMLSNVPGASPAGGFGGGAFAPFDPSSIPPSRQNFPETWIFDNYLINETETKLTLQIPDAITTWRITAFSINAATGFGIINRPTNIITSQTFFISLSLPYAVKRGEIVTIPITIFNYSNQTLETEVILYNAEQEFYFMELNRHVQKSSDEHHQIQQISIAADKGKLVKFLIFPIKAGEINVKVTATSSLYSDAVWQKLKVEPEGVPKQQNQALYLSIPEGEKISSTFKITDPINNVPESEYITFSVGGHYLVPTVENFEELTEMPTGTGEQNMINFAPSVLILQYLKVNGKLSKEKALVDSLKLAIEVGYQQQLSFRHNNGGYSLFGMETDEESSTWLTAYVVRYFIKASQFVDIEANIIESDLEYLASKQKLNGEFLFTGYLLSSKHKNQYGLTAFILMAFMEDPKYSNMYRKTIENGLEFLNSNLYNVNNINSLSLMAAVIKRGKRYSADVLINQLKAHGKQNNGLRWFSENDQNPANAVETTANAALTLLDTPGDHTSILKWLIEQRNANGGFISCYDTVAGMEALVKFSERYTDIKNVNLKISYTAKDGLGNEVANNEFYVDSNNVLSFQKHELPTTTRHVTFEMVGSGASLVQLTQQYNVNNVQEFRHFNLETQSILRNEKEYILELCFTYISEGDTISATTNRIIIEVNLPSGFRSRAEKNMSLREHHLVESVETKNSESIIILYLDPLKSNMKYCLEIPLDKEDEILLPKPAAILMYDYYNLSRSNTKFYTL